MSSVQHSRSAQQAPIGLVAEFQSAMGLLLAGLDRSLASRLLLVTALALASGALVGLAPVALKELIDAASRATPVPLLPNGGFGIAAVGAVYLLCLALARLIAEIRPYLIGSVEQRLYARLRLRYFGHIMDLPLSIHLSGRTGALGHHLQQAVTGYQIILSCLLNALAPLLVEAATVTLVLISLGQAALAVNLGFTALALWLIVGMHVPQLRAAALAVTDATSATHARLADSLINCEPIKCFGAEARTLDGFRGCCTTLEQRWQALQCRRLHMGAASTAIFALSVASSLAIAVSGLYQGTLSFGSFVLAMLYMVQIIRPLEQLSSAARDISQGLAFIRPLEEALRMPSDGGTPRATFIPVNEPVEADPSGAPIRRGTAQRAAGVSVSFQGVRLSYDGKDPVLRDLDLDIPAGHSLALVGESGSGKSSLARLLLRLCLPDAGCICLDGMPIDTLSIQELRAMVAIVPQDLALLNSTIAANIALGGHNPTPASIAQAAHIADLQDFITTLPCGYDTVIGERGLKLSGGERQRIAIARAVLRDPRLYVFDEASSMLDARTEQTVMRRIAAISRGRTVIMIAHRLAAAQHADEIAVLAGGRVAERGRHGELLSRNGLYAALWHEQQTGLDTDKDRLSL